MILQCKPNNLSLSPNPTRLTTLGKVPNLEKRLRYTVKGFFRNPYLVFWDENWETRHSFEAITFFLSSLYFGKLFFLNDFPISDHGNPALSEKDK